MFTCIADRAIYARLSVFTTVADRAMNESPPMFTCATYITEYLGFPMWTAIANAAVAENHTMLTFESSAIQLAHHFFIIRKQNLTFNLFSLLHV